MKYHFNFQKRYSKRKMGFTLLEMIVVVGIFSLMVVVISSILNSVFLSRKVIIAREKLQSDSNSIIEIMAKNIRTSRLDYQQCYDASQSGGIDLTATNPVDKLCLVDKDDNRVTFRKSQDQGRCRRTPDICLVIEIGESSNWANITPTGVNLVDIKFYLEPASDPFAPSAIGRLNKQPLAIIILKTEAQVGQSQSKVSNLIQTSVSSRTYQKRDF